MTTETRAAKAVPRTLPIHFEARPSRERRAIFMSDVEEREAGRDGFEPIAVERERPAARPVPALRGPFMTILSSLRGACTAAPSLRPSASVAVAATSSRRPSSFSPISNAAGRSMPACCAPRWKLPSAPPMPRAPGTGKRPTTPARPRRSCSSANTARRSFRKAGSPAAALPHACEDRKPPSHPYAPFRGEPSAPAVLDPDPARPRRAALAAAITPADLRAGAVGRHRASRHPRRDRRRLARPERVGRDARAACSPISFRASP